MREHVIRASIWFASSIGIIGMGAVLLLSSVPQWLIPVGWVLLFVGVMALGITAAIFWGREQPETVSIPPSSTSMVNIPNLMQVQDSTFSGNEMHVRTPVVAGPIVPSPPPAVRLPPLGEDPLFTAAALKIEIREMLFQRMYYSYLSTAVGYNSSDGWRVLIDLKLTNRGKDELIIVDDWALDIAIGDETRTASFAPIPGSLVIRRPATSPFTEGRIEEIKPHLDKVLRTSGLRKAVPVSGWVLFELKTSENSAPPHAAKFVLIIKDSMGRSYQQIKGPYWSNESGELTSRPVAPSENAS